MSKQMLKYLSLAVAMAFVIMLSSGCGKDAGAKTETSTAVSAASSATETATVQEPLKEVILKFYFPGNQLSATPEVWKAVAEKTKEQLNARFATFFLPWSDYGDKLKLLAASGDNYDMNFDADWNIYASMVNKGAYLALNELLPKYAPKLYEIYEKYNYLPACSLGGKIYSLPWTLRSVSRPAFLYRKDLLGKYGLAQTEFTTIEDMDKYVYAAKKAEPDKIPFRISSSGIVVIQSTLCTKYEYDMVTLRHNFVFGLNDADVKIVPIEQTDMFKEAIMLAKRWYDDGIIPKDAMTDKTAVSVEKGNTVAAITTLEGLLMKVPVEVAGERGGSLLYPDKKFAFNSPTGNIMCINKNAANPERSLMFMELLSTSQEVYDLVMYGIKDKTYVLDGNKAKYPEGMDASKSSYMDWSGQWAFWRSDFIRPTDQKDEMFWKEFNSKMDEPVNVISPLAGFILDEESIKTELAKRDAIFAELATPLKFGAVNDVENALNDLIEKEKAAGLDKILAEYQKQADAFRASNK